MFYTGIQGYCILTTKPNKNVPFPEVNEKKIFGVLNSRSGCSVWGYNIGSQACQMCILGNLLSEITLGFVIKYLYQKHCCLEMKPWIANWNELFLIGK